MVGNAIDHYLISFLFSRFTALIFLFLNYNFALFCDDGARNFIQQTDKKCIYVPII